MVAWALFCHSDHSVHLYHFYLYHFVLVLFSTITITTAKNTTTTTATATTATTAPPPPTFSREYHHRPPDLCFICYLMGAFGCRLSMHVGAVGAGIWNERASDATYAKTLRATLDKAGFANTTLVAKDGGADICDDMAADKEYAAAIGVIGESSVFSTEGFMLPFSSVHAYTYAPNRMHAHVPGRAHPLTRKGTLVLSSHSPAGTPNARLAGTLRLPRFNCSIVQFRLQVSTTRRTTATTTSATSSTSRSGPPRSRRHMTI